MEFGSFNTARRTIKKYEIMHMLKKVGKGAVIERVKFIAEIFGPLLSRFPGKEIFCPQ